MPTPGSERQASYRFWHPQLNITFAWRSEYHAVLRACAAKQVTPSDVLLHWARGVLQAETAWVPQIPAESPENASSRDPE